MRTFTYLLMVILFVSSVVFFTMLYFSINEMEIDEVYITVEPGETLGLVADEVSEAFGINERLLKTLFYAQGIQDDLKAGTYYFSSTASMLEITRRLTEADYNVPTITVTIFEGIPTFQVAEILGSQIPGFDTEGFIQYVKDNTLEGYLYPDTYNFAENVTVEEVVRIMRDNYEKKLSSIQEIIDQSPYTEFEILTMASLVEGEAGNAPLETRREVAGVLWNRVEIGMPIQADAVFPFIYQKPLPRVLFVHLEVDSPYNIYKNLGLPPGPINHPSIVSIQAAADPAETDYLFYLTGFDGEFYFAKTNGGHEQNRRLHLNYRN